MKKNSINVVVIGGGTGIFPVTTALKHIPGVSITTIIAVSDSGGSTGRIRDEFGFQPVGDLRQSLAALAESDGQEWIRKLLLYRFEKGSGLKGHNLGNLILTALQDMTGSTSEALYRAQSIFRLDGEVIPSTTENVDLKIVYTDGTQVVGEHTLDETPDTVVAIDHVELDPPAALNPFAAKAIQDADVILIGPGDYFASIMAALSPTGIQEAFAQSQAHIGYIMNLMTRLTQTNEMSAKDHLLGIEKKISKRVDSILINSQEIPSHIRAAYEKEHEHPVENDLSNDPRVIAAPIISSEVFNTSKVDTAHRSVLRHDSQALTQVLAQLVQRAS